MSSRMIFALGAVTVAGFAMFGLGRQLERWRRSNLGFEFSLDELFI
jgi:hypothetical protein